MKRTNCLVMMTIVAVCCAQQTLAQRGHSKAQDNSFRTPVLLAREVRHELLMLPWYGVFDWLEAQVLPNNTVVLRGQVVKAVTRSDAEKAVKEIDGVKGVDNQIQVLPLSPSDDRLRRALYRALFNFDSPLFRYATTSNPSIHIVVDRGRATLRGVVANKFDSNYAYTKARGVSGLFEVKNELVVESELPR